MMSESASTASQMTMVTVTDKYGLRSEVNMDLSRYPSESKVQGFWDTQDLRLKKSDHIAKFDGSRNTMTVTHKEPEEPAPEGMTVEESLRRKEELAEKLKSKGQAVADSIPEEVSQPTLGSNALPDAEEHVGQLWRPSKGVDTSGIHNWLWSGGRSSDSSASAVRRL